MSIKINFKNNIPRITSANLALFVDEKFNINPLEKHISKTEYAYISDLLKTSDLSKNLFVFELSSKKKVILISIKKNIEIYDVENLGAEFYGRINYGKKSEYFINTDSIISQHKEFIGHFLHGLKLKSYQFDKYKTKKENRIITINVFGGKNKFSTQSQIKFKSIEDGTFYARDLVSEPGNILHPDEYAKRINSLKKLGYESMFMMKRN